MSIKFKLCPVAIEIFKYFQQHLLKAEAAAAALLAHNRANMSRTSCGKLLQSPASLASQYPPLYLQRQQLASVRVQLNFTR